MDDNITNKKLCKVDSSLGKQYTLSEFSIFDTPSLELQRIKEHHSRAEMSMAQLNADPILKVVTSELERRGENVHHATEPMTEIPSPIIGYEMPPEMSGYNNPIHTVYSIPEKLADVKPPDPKTDNIHVYQNIDVSEDPEVTQYNNENADNYSFYVYLILGGILLSLYANKNR